MDKSVVFIFIRKTLFFVLPFLILYFINYLFLNKEKGDLARIGYLYSFDEEKQEKQEEYKYYNSILDFENFENLTFDVINIGDSFSQQNTLGYQNYLAQKNIRVLNIENNPKNNPVDILTNLLNTNFFDRVRTKYIILESIERSFLKRCQKITKDESNFMNIEDLIADYKNYVKKTDSPSLGLFSKELFKAPFINLSFLIGDVNPKGSSIYKLKTQKPLFNRKDELLFFNEDYNMTSYNNDLNNINIANKNLNIISEKLRNKGISLIVLVCPDKFDLYYSYIIHKENLEKPLFFKNMKSLEKKYTLIRSKEVLLKEVENNQDVYYYYDTHWSPIAAKSIANEIINVLQLELKDN